MDANEAIAQLERRVRQLEDEREIRYLIGRYGHYADLGYEEAWGDQWTEDGVYDLVTVQRGGAGYAEPMRFEGKAELLGMIRDPAAHKVFEGRSLHLQDFNLVVRIVGNRPDAEEVLQEVFLQAWRSASHYDRARGTPEAWLIMMARTRAIDLLRAARRTLARPEAEPMPEVPAPTADTGGALEARAAVTSALQDLTPAQREVLELAFYEGLSQTEIAIRTGSPLGTVKTRTRMVLERLRQTFLMKGWSR